MLGSAIGSIRIEIKEPCSSDHLDTETKSAKSHFSTKCLNKYVLQKNYYLSTTTYFLNHTQIQLLSKVRLIAILNIINPLSDALRSRFMIPKF